MKRVSLRSKDVKNLIDYDFEISKKDSCVMIDDSILVINGVPSFFYYEKKLLPTLKLLQNHDLLKEIVVDMGAIKFVTKGADIMRPGITKIDLEIQKGEAVVVIDEVNSKPLAVGIALFDGKDMEGMDSGKVIKNVHYVGDELWKLVV